VITETVEETETTEVHLTDPNPDDGATLPPVADDKPADDTSPVADPADDDTEATDELDLEERRHPGHSHDGPTKGGHNRPRPEEQTEEDDDEDRTLEDALDSTSTSVQPIDGGRRAVMQIGALRDALGTEPTPAVVRRIKRDAELGDTLLTRLVDNAVREKVRALGDTFDAAAYRGLLMDGRNLAHIDSEIETWRQIKAGTFKAGRQVETPDQPEDTKARRHLPEPPPASRSTDDTDDAPATSGSPNLFARKRGR
jgi:hypothetical protein